MKSTEPSPGCGLGSTAPAPAWATAIGAAVVTDCHRYLGIRDGLTLMDAGVAFMGASDPGLALLSFRVR